MNTITVLEKGEESSELSRLLDDLNVSYFANRQCGNDCGFKRKKEKQQQEMQQYRPITVTTDALSSSSLCQILKCHGYIDIICPIHISHLKEKILHDTISPFTPPPLQSIRDYYGEGMAFYFAWMHHITKWIVAPGLMGLVVYLLRIYRGDTVDNCDLTPFVGLGTFFWAVLCHRYWERQEARWSYIWGTLAITERDRLNCFGKRTDFVGEMRVSSVSGKMERYYSPSKRRVRFVMSALVTMLLLSGACLMMVISMNLQGHVSREDQERWGEEEHPLYFPLFARLAEEGNIFDAHSCWKSFIPIILRAIVVMNMNRQYRKVAERLTKWENHETTVDFENSVILKRVLFEAFDAYIILFYLAIYERDIHKLRFELVGAFNMDTFRRLITECILPYLVQRISKK